MDEEKNDRSPSPGEEKAAEDASPVESTAPSDGDETPPEPEVEATGETADGEEDSPEDPPSAEEKPRGAKPAAARKRPRPVKQKGPAYEDLEEGDLVEALRDALGDDLLSAQTFLEQDIYTVSKKRLLEALLLLREDHDFDYLVDLTALDYLGDAERWCLVYHLFSHSGQALIRLKVRLQEGDVAPSVSAIWKSADWMEREIYDMFGIEFTGHPDLKRILLPDDWHGHPLRKDYDIKLQDQSWINKHLRIRKIPN